jgi:CheY-like chemotaxis protein
MLSDVLKATGARVIEAASGEEAIYLALRKRPEIALLDLVMPNVDGLEAIKVLRAEFPEMKIVALSGGGRNRFHDILNLADRLGANAVLAKPFSPEELLELLQTRIGMEIPGSAPPRGKAPDTWSV